MENIIEMRNITKVFPGIIANDDITLELRKGEIHALLGENGAGKSTLMSVLFGLYQPTSGKIIVKGKEVKMSSPNTANDLGIGMVHQHFKLVGVFSALENIILGVETVQNGFLKMNEAREKIIGLSEKYGLMVDIDEKIDNMTVGMQQRVEILKMLYRDNDVLIFDEPTAVLTPQEIEELIKIIRRLAEEGKSILFISHKLNEIKEVSDRCSVLRKGKYIGTVDTDSVTVEELSEMMVGRSISLHVEKTAAKPKDVVLSVKNLTVMPQTGKKEKVKNVSFDVRAGEIVCIAGIDNNGQQELVFALTGMLPSKGDITLNGEVMTDKSIRYRNTHGISHIPEDRHKHGLVLDFNISQNMILQTYFEKDFIKNGFLKFSDITKFSDKAIEDFDVRSAKGSTNIVRNMSGGNQQKVILAREIIRDHNLLIAVQPTRGLDVGAIEFVHKQLVKERDEGKAVLLVSLELDEVMEVSDRILVMHDGEIMANVRPENVTVQKLGLYMSGAEREEAV